MLPNPQKTGCFKFTCIYAQNDLLKANKEIFKDFYRNLRCLILYSKQSHAAITCSKLTETLEQGVKYVKSWP